MTAVLPPTSSAPVPLRDWLTTAGTLLEERRAHPRDLVENLVAQGGSWSPRDGLVFVAGRVAEAARTDLRLACALIHHVTGVMLLDSGGAGAPPGGDLLAGSVESTIASSPVPGHPATVSSARRVVSSGQVRLCCPPAAHDGTLIVLDRSRRVLAVPMVQDDGGSVTVRRDRPDGWRIELSSAPAVAYAALPEALDQHVHTLCAVLEAAAWYGALTRLGDGLLAQVQHQGLDDHAALVRTAEVEAILGATWGSIRDAATVWQRGQSSVRTAAHSAARARTLTRMAASSVLFSYVPIEDDVARQQRVSVESRERLVRWLGRGDPHEDARALAALLVDEGPSW